MNTIDEHNDQKKSQDINNFFSEPRVWVFWNRAVTGIARVYLT
jgi:hypothetical protein